MKKLIYLGCLEILFLVFISFKLCESGDKSNKISIDDFPMTVGSQWTFVRTDSLFEYGDPKRTVVKETVTVQIANEHSVNSKEKILEWIRTFDNTVDTEYAVIQGDTIMLATSMDPVKSSVVFHFVFPIKIGKGWSGPSSFRNSDYYMVMEPESVLVPAGNFATAYLIRRITGDLSNLGLIKYWVVPKIGIVKMTRSNLLILGKEYYPTSSAYEKIAIWELIEYKVKE